MTSPGVSSPAIGIPGETTGTGMRPSSTPVLIARATILNQRGTTLWNIGRLEAAIENDG